MFHTVDLLVDSRTGCTPEEVILHACLSHALAAGEGLNHRDTEAQRLHRERLRIRGLWHLRFLVFGFLRLIQLLACVVNRAGLYAVHVLT